MYHFPFERNSSLLRLWPTEDDNLVNTQRQMLIYCLTKHTLTPSHWPCCNSKCPYIWMQCNYGDLHRLLFFYPPPPPLPKWCAEQSSCCSIPPMNTLGVTQYIYISIYICNCTLTNALRKVGGLHVSLFDTSALEDYPHFWRVDAVMQGLSWLKIVHT